MLGQLLDVVHQAIQLPLRIDLSRTSQREAIELLVMPEVGKYVLDCKAMTPDRGLEVVVICVGVIRVADEVDSTIMSVLDSLLVVATQRRLALNSAPTTGLRARA